MSSIASLNTHWSHSGLTFREGSGGFSIATLNHRGSEASVALHGAQVLSYIPSGERPVLWCSEHAIYKEGKAIRGGVPVCWPWFADHPDEPSYPAHGFARTQAWTILETSGNQDEVSLTLSLQQNQDSLKLWPHAFELTLKVILSDTLRLEFEVVNLGLEPFTFTGALHSYFAISAIDQIHVTGLEGATYIDSVDKDARKCQESSIRIAEEVDRLFIDTEATTAIVDQGWNRKITISKSGSHSTVVWNPWIAKATRMNDFGDEEYLKMVCVETANAADNSVTVTAAASHQMVAEIQRSPHS